MWWNEVSKEESTSTGMPLEPGIHKIEITLKRGGQLNTSADVAANLIAKERTGKRSSLPEL